MLTNTIDEIGRERRIDENGVIQTSGRISDSNGAHLLEHTKWVALGQELLNGPLVQVSGDEQHDVIDHVRVRDVVEELAQIANRVVAQVNELGYVLLADLVVDGRDRERARLVRQEVAVVRRLQVQFEIF